MKRYSKYKDSNSEWIGEIPEHWECTRLVNLGTFTASGIDKKINEDEELVKIINFTDIYSNSSNLLNSKRAYMEVTAPSYKVEEHQVKKGDLLFLPSSETFEDLGLSALVDEDLPNTAFSYHVIRLQFDKPFDHRFKKYLANNYNLLNYFSSEGKGTTRKILNRDSFKNACVVVPPLPEQTQISSYLDNKTSLIDKLIYNNKKLIKLLEEKRTALINKVITKGLDPNVKMKNSGIEWIGEIPEHWELKKFGYFGTFLKGRGISKSSLSEKGNPVILYGDIYTKYYLKTKEAVRYAPNSVTDNSEVVYKGDLLMTGSGETKEEIGKCIVYLGDEKVYAGGDVIIFRQESQDSLYLSYLLNSSAYEFEKARYGKGQIIVHIYSSQLKDIKAMIPPLSEQKSISAYLDNKTSLIDKAIKRTKEENNMLKDYRQSLISNVVTGKVDVRHN